MNVVIACSDEHTIAIPAWLMQTLGLQEGDQIEAVVASNTLHFIAQQPAQQPYATNGENTTNPIAVQTQDDLRPLDEFIAAIKALPPNLSAVHPATKSVDQLLAELETNPPSEELFTFHEWQDLWRTFEEEQDALEYANN